MINEDKWINSLSVNKKTHQENEDQINPSMWIAKAPKKNNYTSGKKYILTSVLFVSGLLLVSAVKNETRNIQKEINNLETSIDNIKHNLGQAALDNEVITSPEYVAKLAKEYLSNDFVFYKKSQIKDINDKSKIITKESKKIKKLSTEIKTQIAKQIDQKKSEIRTLQNLYRQPKSIPGEIKHKVAKTIQSKKKELKKLYSSPKEMITLKKTQKWAAVQVVKALLGMPIIPGK